MQVALTSWAPRDGRRWPNGRMGARGTRTRDSKHSAIGARLHNEHPTLMAAVVIRVAREPNNRNQNNDNH
jgi:hypothetical protein